MTSGYVIRKATLADVEAIRRMQAESYCHAYVNDELGITEEWLKEYTDRWLTPEEIQNSKDYLAPYFDDSDTNFYRIALHEGKVVALFHANVNEDGDKLLWGLYVDAAHHGTGLAQELMELGNGYFKDEKVVLEVASYNERAKAFYRKCGFVEDPDFRDVHAERIPVVMMIREAGTEDTS